MGLHVHHISRLVVVLVSQTLSASSTYIRAILQRFLRAFPTTAQELRAMPILMHQTFGVLVSRAQTWSRSHPLLSTHHMLVVLDPELLRNTANSSSCCNLMLFPHSTSYAIIYLLHLSLKCKLLRTPTVFFLLQAD